jgi:hypothetical protein
VRARVIEAHLPKLAIGLSAVAIALWATGLQPADAVTVVKRALSARNADAVDHLSASRKPKPGRLLALGANGKFPASAIPTTARGPRGAQGPIGPVGPSDGYVDDGATTTTALSTQANVPTAVAKLSLPAGSYMLSSDAQVSDFVNPALVVYCAIRVNGASVADTGVVLGTSTGSVRMAVASTSAGVTRPNPFDVTLECRPDVATGPPPEVRNQRLTATRVGSLNGGG